jgi:cobalt-zinc-cadmium efflux system membrane fusion protein
VCVALAAGLLAACAEERPPPPSAKRAGDRSISLADPSKAFVAVESARPAGQGVAAPLPARIAFRPQALLSVGAPAAGRVAAVLVRPGETVKAGTPLISVQSAEAAATRAMLAQATARLAAAEETFKRQQEMLAKGVGLESERFEAETRLREVRAEIDSARRASQLLGTGQGDLVTLRAPGAGVVTNIRAAVGAMVAPGGDALVEIGDASRLWAVAEVAESDAARVAAGQTAVVSVPGSDRELRGRVDGVGAAVDAETRRMPVYVALEGDLRGLSPGMRAEIRVEYRGSGVTVPVAAVLIRDGQRRVVYVQRADGRFEARDVRTGTAHAGRVSILEGLAPGERIVVRGALLLDGEAEQLL